VALPEIMGILRDEDKPKIRIEDVDADIDYNE
jgi:hypothetical protein